ncbi:MAG: hypothetical protein WD512_03280 [Candidatus Paceibacterota bacterium]
MTVNRVSPTISATSFPEGTKRKGNDGHMWRVVADKNQRKRLAKSTTRSRSTSVKKRRDVKGLCKKRLQKKIETNIKEYEMGRYKSRAQAIAVSYAQVNKTFPECRKYYELSK